MNYGQLIALVNNYIKRTDVAPVYPQIQELVNERLSKDARLIVMEKDVTFTFDTATQDLPADFASFKSVRGQSAAGRYPLSVLNKQQLDNWTGADGNSGNPVAYAVYSNVIEIGPFAESASIFATYYCRPALMVNDADTNPVLTKWPSLYLYAFLTYVANNLQDINLENVYSGQYTNELNKANESDAFASMSGNAPRMLEY